MSFLKRIRKHARTPVVIDFLKADKRLPYFVSFSRPDAAPCATRRRITNAVGPSRTNLIPYSEQFDDAGWTKVDATVTANAANSPLGTPTADKLVEGVANSNHTVSRSIGAATVGAAYCGSVHLKPAERGFAFVGFNGGGVIDFVSVNLATGAVSVANNGSGTMAFGSVAAANGFWRVFVKSVASAAVPMPLDIRVSADGVWANRTYLGDGASGIYAWGAMVETAITMTPYIGPTLGAAVTTTDWPRTNKCTSANVNPVSLNGIGTSIPAGAAVVASIVNDAAELERKGLSSLCSAGTVYKADNSAGTATGYVFCNGIGVTPGTHTWSILARKVAGAGTPVFCYSVNGAAAVNVTNTDYQRLKGTGVAANNSHIQLTLPAGSVVYFILQQIEEGSEATSVITGPYTGAAKTVITPPYGDLEVLAANEPRIDYNADGSARGLLVEPSATQLYARTDDLLSAPWAFSGGIPTAQRQGGFWTPRGYPAFLLTATAGVSSYITGQNTALTNGTTYYRSVEVKPLSANKIVIFETSGGTTTRFDLATTGITGVPAGAALWIDTLEDGWYRCNWLWTVNAAGISAGALYFDNYGAAGAASQFIVGKPTLLQLGSASRPSFVHNGSGANVTRAAESCTVNNLADIGWNANGWSAVVEWEQGSLGVAGRFGQPFELSDGTSNNALAFFQDSAGSIYTTGNSGGAAVWSNIRIGATAVAPAGSMCKLAFALMPGGLLASINGSAAQFIAGELNLAALTRANVAGTATNSAGKYLDGWLRRIKAWSRVLTQGELQEQSL